jgi:UDP-galactopyranose mutase
MPSTDYREINGPVDYGHLVYTGPVDEYFDLLYGKLPYRSLRFEHTTLDQEWLQPVAVVNYPAADVPFTRITEYKHLTGQPMPGPASRASSPATRATPTTRCPRRRTRRCTAYEDLAERTPGVTFTGRLGTYRYYNMDQVVGQATFRRLPATPGQQPAGTAAVAGA